MHHQVVVLDEEIGSGITVAQLSWMIHGGTSTTAYESVDVWMGLCSSDQLCNVFLDNYIPGTRTLVCHLDDTVFTVIENDWLTVQLDTPFEYHGTRNLLIEINHLPGAGDAFCWSWQGGGGRAIYSCSPDSPYGSFLTIAPMMMLTDELGLHQATFGSIKTTFLQP